MRRSSASIRTDSDASNEATPVPSRRIRLLLALGASLLSGVRTALWAAGDAKARDFDQVWYAARAMFAGRNPYLEIGPGLAFDWSAYFYYPLTAPISVAPLAALPRHLAAVIFAALGSGAFVWAVTRRSLAPAVVITSASAAMAAEAVQWSPLLGAAIGAPWFGIFLASKPTIGLAVFLARPTRIALLGGLAFGLIAMVLQPSWPADWLTALRQTSVITDGGTPYLAPVVTTGGIWSLLLLFRWRRPEARLVLALACIPQTPLLYGTVPLFVVPHTIGEGGLLWLGSWLSALWLSAGGPYASRLARFTVSATAIGWLMYLPCVLMVLRRPNEGSAPAWLEGRLARSRLPVWLVGRPAVSPPRAPDAAPANVLFQGGNSS